MVGNTGTLMTMRVVRSKLRKRDESTSTSGVTIEAQPQQQGRQSRSNSYENNRFFENQDQQKVFPTPVSSDDNDNNSANNSMELESIVFDRMTVSCSTPNGWVFPPKAPSPNIYTCVNHDKMVTVGEHNGLRGFKKQFSGRFKRLVSNKKEATSPIPPELKPQLKTIYVY